MDLVFALPQANPAAAPDGDHEQEHEDLLDDITVHTAGRAQGGRALVYSDDDDPAEQPPSKRARNHLEALQNILDSARHLASEAQAMALAAFTVYACSSDIQTDAANCIL